MAIYLDHAATTAMDGDVWEAMLPYFGAAYGNASSRHALGREAETAVDRAREKVAKVLGVLPAEVYFTSGGTESDNWILKGVAYANRDKGRHIVATAVEHHAVLSALEQLVKEGYEVDYVPVDEAGLVRPDVFASYLRRDTVLATCMYVNNEVGAVEPVGEIGAICRERGVLFHTDAVQAVGVLDLDAGRLNADFLSLSAHKFYGPKGVGAAYIRKGVKIEPLLAGGAQERGLRAGTYNTPAIVGLSVALEKAVANAEANRAYVKGLRDDFVRKVRARIEGVTVNGDLGQTAPSIVNLRFAGTSGERILNQLDLAGICASAGSACTAGTLEVSRVLRAMGLSAQAARECVRFSFGRDNTPAEIDETADVLAKAVARLRK